MRYPELDINYARADSAERRRQCRLPHDVRKTSDLLLFHTKEAEPAQQVSSMNTWDIPCVSGGHIPASLSA